MWNMKTKDPKPEHVINVMAAVSVEYVFKNASWILVCAGLYSREIAYSPLEPNSHYTLVPLLAFLWHGTRPASSLSSERIKVRQRHLKAIQELPRVSILTDRNPTQFFQTLLHTIGIPGQSRLHMLADQHSRLHALVGHLMASSLQHPQWTRIFVSGNTRRRTALFPGGCIF